jgi:cell division septal protein FtsQ
VAVGRLKSAVYAASAVGAAALIWFGGPALGRRMSFFRVRRIELVGLRYGTPAQVLAALKIPRELSVFDDFGAIERRAAKLPGVKRAAVRRGLPATLRVTLEEVAPVAVTPVGEGMRLMDARGRLLPFDPARAAPDLPVAETADAGVAGLLARLADFDPELFARVATARRETDDVVLDVALDAGAKSLRFRPDASTEDMLAVMAVAEQLARTGRKYRELDGRFAGQVIVRGGA